MTGRRFFTFSQWDVWTSQCTPTRRFLSTSSNANINKKTTKRRICWSATLLLLLLATLQGLLIIRSSTILLPETNSSLLHSKNSILNSRNDFDASKSSVASVATVATKDYKHASTFRKPRLLIGIIGNSNNHMGKVYRWRHRSLFELWNDTRLCSLHDFQEQVHALAPPEITRRPPAWRSYADVVDNGDNDDDAKIDCQVIYTFVVGGHNETSGVAPYLLDDSRPLTLKSIPIMPRFKDVNNTDVTLLNIAENMNDGKTPTFFFWASQVAKKYGLDYIMKCDSDALLRLGSLLQFLYKEFPWSKPSSPGVRPQLPATLLGSFRHKAFWNKTEDETFWKNEYYHGMHLYIAGQLYMVSIQVADYIVQEAREVLASATSISNVTGLALLKANYMEGHEDHDATSMMQKGSAHTPIRWISMPRHYKFWEHPVKGEFWWKKIWRREQKKLKEGKRAPNFNYREKAKTIATEAVPKRSLLIILGATTRTAQENYLIQWKLANPEHTICPVTWKDDPSPSKCDIYYIFVVGGNPNGGTEQLHDAERLLLDSEDSNVWPLNIRENVHNGMGTTILYLLHERLASYTKRFDFVLFILSQFQMDLEKWERIRTLQSTPHSLLIGDIRDKDQRPVEDFVHAHQSKNNQLDEDGLIVRNETYWYHEFENIHLYLGSNCLAIGTSLVAGIVEQAQGGAGDDDDSRARSYLMSNLGHDLTTLAYFVPKTVLHWIPISRSIRFWKKMDE